TRQRPAPSPTPTTRRAPFGSAPRDPAPRQPSSTDVSLETASRYEAARDALLHGCAAMDDTSRRRLIRVMLAEPALMAGLPATNRTTANPTTYTVPRPLSLRRCTTWLG